MFNERLNDSGLLMPVREDPGLSKISPSLVRIYDSEFPLGSGFILEEDNLFLVTAAHVIWGGRSDRKRILFASGEDIEIGREDVIFVPKKDVALVPLNELVSKGSLVALRRSELLRTLHQMGSQIENEGSLTIAAGFPYSYIEHHRLNEIALYSVGRALELWVPPGSDRESNPSLLVTSNRVESGMSGGPLLDQENAVVGVISNKPGFFGTSFKGIFYSDDFRVHVQYNYLYAAILPEIIH